MENALREVRRDKSIIEIIGRVSHRPGRRLPVLPSDADVQRLLDVLERDGKLKIRIMMKLFLYTGLRNSELRMLKIADIDMTGNRIRVEQGKGKKDRYIPIFKEYRDTLLLYLNTIPKNRYLFENKFAAPYSDSYIRRTFREYCAQANLPRIHPHLFRHYFLTFLTRAGWTDAQIMLISGHDSKESLKIYQHLALPDIEEKFQEDMRGMKI